MPRRNRVREAALAEAKKAHRAAGQKVSRLEHAPEPIHIRKAGLDPRTDMSQVNSMNTRQLRQYTNRLRDFTSRETAFVAGDAGQPIRKNLWRQYERAERMFNNKANAFEQRIGNVYIPGQKQTIAQRLKAIEAPEIAKAGQSNRIFGQVNRTPDAFESEEDLQQAIDEMKKRGTGEYLHETLERRFNSMKALLEGSNNEEFISQMEDMSDDELAVALEYSPLGDIAQERFYPNSDTVAKRDAAYEARTGENYADEIKRQIQVVLDWSRDVVSGKAARNSRPGKRRK